MKSNTDSNLNTPVQYLKGVGPRVAEFFSAKGIHTFLDLLEYFPRSYQDRSQLKCVSELTEGEVATVAVRVLSSRVISIRGGKKMFDVRTEDRNGDILQVRYFYFHKGIEALYRPGVSLILTSAIKRYGSQLQMVHPEIAKPEAVDDSVEGSVHYGRMVPVYSEVEGVSSKVLRQILHDAFDKVGHLIPEDLPEYTVRNFDLPSRAEAIRSLHFPPSEIEPDALESSSTIYHRRLIFEELFKFEYLVLKRRLRMKVKTAQKFDLNLLTQNRRELSLKLPFQLTGGQESALDEIFSDIHENKPMNRLLQGDVGSGKTAVAFITAATLVACGSQTALMAPTEILAEQHLAGAQKLLGVFFPVELLTGKTPQSERTRILARLERGEPLLLIGTHALIEDPVKFRSLDLIVIDEQHRFGVDQRRALREKGVRSEVDPHLLVMTATPIPRTLALTAYGDLDVSSLREKPPGRTPIETRLIAPRSRKKALDRVRDKLIRGEQAYFIYPLVSESEAEGFKDLRSATQALELLQDALGPTVRIGLLHGQMKPSEKTEVMEHFKRGELHVLVSTTVVEVGVDVPNATVIAIEHAERFGLSQLHQLRGRVGRGSRPSECLLLPSAGTSDSAYHRLRILESETDGFKIAEADLKIRGPGEFIGRRQSGALPFKIADLVRDQDLLFQARDQVLELLKQDPNLLHPEHLPLRKYLHRSGHEAEALLQS